MTATRETDLHRPHDRETLRVAAYELHSRGLTARDIASCLRLSEGAVRELLGLQTGSRHEPLASGSPTPFDRHNPIGDPYP